MGSEGQRAVPAAEPRLRNPSLDAGLPGINRFPRWERTSTATDALRPMVIPPGVPARCRIASATYRPGLPMPGNELSDRVWRVQVDGVARSGNGSDAGVRQQPL